MGQQGDRRRWQVLRGAAGAALALLVAGTGMAAAAAPAATDLTAESARCVEGEPQLPETQRRQLEAAGAQLQCTASGALVITYPAAPVTPRDDQPVGQVPGEDRPRPEDFDGWVFVWVNGVPLRTPPAADGGYEPDAFVVQSTGRTVMPIRFITEAIGGEVEWDPATQGVTLRWRGRAVHLTIGSRQAQVDGRPVVIDQPAFLWQDRTFVPTRFLMEAFGAQVTWDPDNSSVLVSLPGARCSSHLLCGEPRGGGN